MERDCRFRGWRAFRSQSLSLPIAAGAAAQRTAPRLNRGTITGSI
jgi:hypothetical protein